MKSLYVFPGHDFNWMETIVQNYWLDYKIQYKVSNNEVT